MIGRVRHRLKSDFFRNVTTLATGTTAAQAVSILTAPVLYRIYDKEDYGTLGQYMAIVGVVGVFSTMQYHQVVLLEKDDEDAKKVIWLNQLINMCLTLVLTIVVFLFNTQIANILNNPKVATWLYLLPLSIFFTGQNLILREWANRKKNYNLMTFNAILTAISVPIISISVGLTTEGVLGLFLGLLTSQIIPPIMLFIGLNRKDDLGIKYLDFEFIKSRSREYKNFPLYIMPSEFINRFTNQLPVFMLSTYAGTSVVGVYNLCVRMLGLPVQLIGGAISEVFKQKVVEIYTEYDDFESLFIRTAKNLALIALPFAIVVFFFSPFMFSIIFGSGWTNAGYFAQYLIIMFYLRFVVSPLTYVIILRRKLYISLFLDITLLILVYLSFYIGLVSFNSNKVSIMLFSLTYSFSYIISFIISRKLTIKSHLFSE